MPLRADSFLLENGATIEGSIVRATKSSVAIKRAIGGLQLIRLSSIDEVRIERPGKAAVVGRLIGWTGGIHVVDVGGKIVEMRDGDILREISSQPARNVIAEPSVPSGGGGTRRITVCAQS